MYGLTLLQTYTYYKRFPNDSWRLKLLVFVVWVLDTLHLILCTIAIYWYLVLNYNNPAQLAFTHWSMNLQTDCNGLIGLMVEIFFAQRVWRISKNWHLTCLICILACLHFGLGVFFTVESFLLKEYSRYTQLTWVTSTGLGGAAAADIIIAVSLVYFLLRSRTGFERTDSLITTLAIYAINTGLLTSICATCAVITFAIMPTNFVWISFFWCLGKLYCNSLLASLNSRRKLRAKVLPPGDSTFVLTNMRTESSVQSPTNRRFSGMTMHTPAHRHLAITIETTKEQRTDYYSQPSSPVEKEDESSPPNPLLSGVSPAVLMPRHPFANTPPFQFTPPASAEPFRGSFAGR